MRSVPLALALLAGALAIPARNLSAQSAQPAPSSGWAVQVGFGAFTSKLPGARYPAYQFGVGWGQVVGSFVLVRGMVTRLKGIYVEGDLSCVDLPPPGSGCRPDPEYPSSVWSADADLVVSLPELTMINVVGGVGAATPHGQLGRADRSAPGGISPLWRLGLEFGRPGRAGASVLLSHTWFPTGYFDASGVSVLTVVIRGK